MCQTFLPIYPEDTKMINTDIGTKKIGDKILYFNGGMPMYQHHIDDYKSFRYITSQMIDLKYKNLTLRTNTNYLLMA